MKFLRNTRAMFTNRYGKVTVKSFLVGLGCTLSLIVACVIIGFFAAIVRLYLIGKGIFEFFRAIAVALRLMRGLDAWDRA